MPLFHIHGLIAAVVSSLAAGGSVVCSPGFDASRFFEWIEAFEPTWYTAVPTMHQAILSRAESNTDIIQRHPLRFVRSCSSPLPPTVMAALEETFDAPAIEAYGMTEAAHQVSSNPLPPRQHKAGSVGVPSGPEVAIMDGDGLFLPTGEIGEIVIRGVNVMQGYEKNPAANTAAFSAGWFRTGDQGRIDTDGYLFITGRIKEIINRGGEKISPREVDEVLMDHPGVAQAVTFAAPHPTLGEDVVVAVVLNRASPASESEIRRFARTRLTDSKVPSRVLIVEEIPKGPTGKLQRIGLAEKLGVGPARDNDQTPSRDFVSPRDDIERGLAAIWERLLNVRPVGVTSNFFELGGDSLAGVDLTLEIERRFGRDLPPNVLLEAATIEQLAEIIRGEEAWDVSQNLLVPMRVGGGLPPLYWVHAVGDTILRCRDIANLSRPDRPMYVLQSRGLDGRQAPHTCLEDMARDYLNEMLAVQPDGPYFLSGYSSGGVVAFEIAHQLIALGKEVALLALVDARLRDRRYGPNPRLARSRTYKAIERLEFHARNLILLEAGDRFDYVVSDIKRKAMRVFDSFTGRSSRAPEPPFARVYKDVRAANLAAIERYKTRPYPGRITLFMSGEELVRTSDDSRLGWSRLAVDGLELHLMPGDHLTMLRAPENLKVVVRELDTCIRRADDTSPGRNVPDAIHATTEGEATRA
jgi:thioesterase domain-containing protein/acyl carrier protein